jgi:hypothetical protein
VNAPKGASRTDALLLGLLIAGLGSLYAVYALRIGNFQDDENQYLELARYVSQHFPGALFQSGLYPRGTQRLDPIILALPFALLRGPGAYQLGHIIQCALFVSTAIPVFLIARQADLGRAASLFAATLCLIVPWALSATSFLAECAAYPAYAWVLYATWAVIRRPSLQRQVLVLVALVVAALARTALLALVPVPALAVLWHEWSWQLAGKPWRVRARQLPARLWSRYRLLAVLVVLALLVYILDQLELLPGRGLAALAGDYGLPHVGSLSILLNRYDSYLARMAAGTGFLALALALPWAVRVLARPREEALHTLAVISTLGLGAILLSLLQAGPDERYVLYGAVPIALASAAALREWARGPRSPVMAAIGVLIGAAVVIALVANTSWPPLANPFDFFTFPSAIFYQRVLLTHASFLHLPLIHPSPELLVEAAIVIAALAWVLLAARWRGARPAVLLAICLIALCAVQTLYGLRKFSATAGEANGANAAARSWVDEQVPAGTDVGALAVSMGETLPYAPLWRATEFWNTSVDYDAFFASAGGLPIPLYSKLLHLTLQPDSGLLKGYSGPSLKTPVAVPRYLLVPNQGTNALGIAGKVVAASSYVALVLVHLSQPARVEWSTAGTSPEGFMTSGKPATAIVYSDTLAAEQRPCATFKLIAPPNFTGRWPYSVQSGGRVVVRGSLAALQTVALTAPLHARANGTATLAVRVQGSVASAAGTVSARLAFFAVGECPVKTP